MNKETQPDKTKEIFTTINYWVEGLLTEPECDWHLVTTQGQREALRAKEQARKLAIEGVKA